MTNPLRETILIAICLFLLVAMGAYIRAWVEPAEYEGPSFYNEG